MEQANKGAAMEKMTTFVNALKENRRIAGFWAVTLLIVAGAWWMFTGKSPDSANADEATNQPAAQPAPAQPAPAAQPSSTPAIAISPGKPRLAVKKGDPGKLDEYQYMAQMNNLQGEQLEKFEQACARREVVLAFWAEGPGKQVEELRKQMKDAKAAKDQATVDEIQEKHDLLNKMDSDIRSQLRAEVMSQLTLEQQRRWGGFVLSRELTRKMPRVELTERQKEFVRRITDDAADKLVKADTVEKDPFLQGFKSDEILNPLMKHVRDKILTIDQRARVGDPMAKPGTTGVTVKRGGPFQ
jgi:hypothetical protein